MVDFENTQPEHLDELPVGAFRIKVFIGAAQVNARTRTKFFLSAHRHGANVEYIPMTRSGPNAMDMHIAYFTGLLLAAEPGAAIYIVSKDRDFDPLVEFLQAKGTRCHRMKSITDIMKQYAAEKPAAATPRTAAHAKAPARSAAPKAAAPKAAAPKQAKPGAQPARKPDDARLDAIVKQLRSMSGKPGTHRKLVQTIGTWFKQHGGVQSDKVIEQTIDELVRRRLIAQDGTKVTYSLGA